MRAAAVILACLACIGDARRVQATEPVRDASDQEDGTQSLQSFASLLQAHYPTAGFQAPMVSPSASGPARSSSPVMRYKSPKSKFTYQEKLKMRKEARLYKWSSFPVKETPIPGKRGYVFFQKQMPGVDYQPDLPSFFSGQPLPNKNRKIFPLGIGLIATTILSGGYLWAFANGYLDTPEEAAQNYWMGGIWDPLEGGYERVLPEYLPKGIDATGNYIKK
mmetsp:Transcript_140411/g.269279  ORF Transcript_140411/g.269279 Transcript_140411/m.269279 type:complete len:220 (-) Transcript_140411:119-778(-)